jgi:hypothetical protein
MVTVAEGEEGEEPEGLAGAEPWQRGAVAPHVEGAEQLDHEW